LDGPFDAATTYRRDAAANLPRPGGVQRMVSPVRRFTQRRCGCGRARRRLRTRGSLRAVHQGRRAGRRRPRRPARQRRPGLDLCPSRHVLLPSVTSLNPSDIRALCQAWVDAFRGVGREQQVQGDPEEFRLRRNGIEFPSLEHAELRAVCLGLSETLLWPGNNTYIHEDHLWFWSWCAELLCHPRTTYFAQNEDELKHLSRLCFRAALGQARRSSISPEMNATLGHPVEHNAAEFLSHLHIALTYLSFPLLEAILKKACRKYVTMNGEVITEFTVPRRDGSPHDYKVGKSPCSSTRDLLLLLLERSPYAGLRRDLQEHRTHLQTLGRPGEDGFDLLYRWRNSSLHGSDLLATVGGTVLNTALLVVIGELCDSYASMRDAAAERVPWEVDVASKFGRSPWSYYPPYL
jgi:hypothetical protein